MELFLRIVIGVVFIYSSWDKVGAPDEFDVAIANYRLLPPILVSICAQSLPLIELGTGIFLITGFKKEASVLIAFFLLTIFILFLGTAIIRGLDIECGCFKGVTLPMVWTFIFDLFLLFSVFYVILIFRRKGCL
jgi:uncharacterized membrane protein YphA (DoxX/SURF4 family)